MAERYWGPFAKLRAEESHDIRNLDSFEGISASLYDAQCVYESDLPCYERLAECHGGPILELCCGTGRVMLQLAKQGHAVVGLDRSADMLAVLNAKLTTLPSAVADRVEVIQADVGTFALNRRFPLILLPYYTFSLMDGREQQLQVLRCVAAHLAPGGTFAFDYVVFPEMIRQATEEQFSRTQLPYGDGKVFVVAGVQFDHAAKQLVANSYYRVVEGSGLVRQYLESKTISLIEAADLEEMLEEAGLCITTDSAMSLDESRAVESRMVCCSARQLRAGSLWHPYIPMNQFGEAALKLVSGEGRHVQDENGKRYIDAAGGLWNTTCGLGHPDIVAAVTQQLRKLSCAPLFAGRTNQPAQDLARELVQIAPEPLEWVYLTGSGSESVELGIKLARLFFALQDETERNEILYLDHSYHGTFFGSLSVTGLFKQKHLFAPLMPGAIPLPTPMPPLPSSGVSYDAVATDCARALEKTILEREGKVAALLIEPVLGSAGVIVPPPEYLRKAEQICRAHGVLLILDEVATGMGRTGKWFALDHFGLHPDILLLSKGISSGYLPLGAVLFSTEIGERLLSLQSGIGHGSTNNGNPVCCAAGLATLEIIRREGLLARTQEMGAYFRSRLEELHAHSCVREVRSLGLMLGLEMMQEDSMPLTGLQLGVVYARVRDAGVLPHPAPSGFSFWPALTITREEIDRIVEVLHTVLSSLSLREGVAYTKRR